MRASKKKSEEIRSISVSATVTMVIRKGVDQGQMVRIIVTEHSETLMSRLFGSHLPKGIPFRLLTRHIRFNSLPKAFNNNLMQYQLESVKASLKRKSGSSRLVHIWSRSAAALLKCNKLRVELGEGGKFENNSRVTLLIHVR